MRFRKSIRLGKLFRINLSGKGASVSVGIPGATMNLKADGTKRITVGVPGTGFSTSKDIHAPTTVTPPRQSMPQSPPDLFDLENRVQLIEAYLSQPADPTPITPLTAGEYPPYLRGQPYHPTYMARRNPILRAIKIIFCIIGGLFFAALVIGLIVGASA